MIVMKALMDKHLAEGDQEGIRKINEELETLEKECTSAQIWTAELMENQVHHLRSLQEEK